MKRYLLLIAMITGTFSTFGCSMCCGPYDYDYPNFTDDQTRVDPAYGRVGSIFSDPNASNNGEGPDSNLKAQPDLLRPGGDSYNDGELDRIRRELEDDLEVIDPLNDPGPGVDPLPTPQDGDTTASRLWKRQPLRSSPAWR